jgi:uncharacterized MnhB-related membrane protein
MTILQVVSLLAVAVAGTATVAVRNPTRQAIVAGFHGLALTIMFFVYAAPDVALSQLTVSTIAVPIMVLLALAKLRQQDEDE